MLNTTWSQTTTVLVIAVIFTARPDSIIVYFIVNYKTFFKNVFSHQLKKLPPLTTLK